MDVAEFHEWWAFYELEPFGGTRVDVAASMICATIANAAPKKRPKRFKPADFMPDWQRISEPRKQMTGNDFFNLFRPFMRMPDGSRPDQIHDGGGSGDRPPAESDGSEGAS